ncbi:MAG: peptidoglycan DD-metalloendopeptidase family protein [Deltaproteobacteria bacterium]|nr:peptidoglycan DD-metalloendopeptidase family protein [Deltaproteobacteria bacterium]
MRRAAVLGLVLALLPTPIRAADRAAELEGLREKIEESRERVTGHEATERAILEELEAVDRRLADGLRERDAARRDVAEARARLDVVRPQLEQARLRLAATRRALSARAVALYRGGEIGPVRVLFAASSLRDLMARVAALRLLVRQDALLVARSASERDAFAAIEAEANALVAKREEATARLSRLVASLDGERRSKASILGRVRRDRTSERRLLVELEQAAQALEATIRSLGARGDASSGGVPQGEGGLVRGALVAPVEAPIAQRFGRVVDPEFQTETQRNGVDFAAQAGEPVRSVARGIVRFAGWFRGYGRIVIIDHGDAYHSVSGHLDEIQVQVDDVVLAGQPIGTVGETGSLAGPSLYFELRKGGSPIDPAPWLAGE